MLSYKVESRHEAKRNAYKSEICSLLSYDKEFHCGMHLCILCKLNQKMNACKKYLCIKV